VLSSLLSVFDHLFPRVGSRIWNVRNVPDEHTMQLVHKPKGSGRCPTLVNTWLHAAFSVQHAPPSLLHQQSIAVLSCYKF